MGGAEFGRPTVSSALCDDVGVRVLSGRRLVSTDSTGASGIATEESVPEQVSGEAMNGLGGGEVNVEDYRWRTPDTPLMNAAPQLPGRLEPIWDGTHLKAKFSEVRRGSTTLQYKNSVTNVYVFHSSIRWFCTI